MKTIDKIFGSLIIGFIIPVISLCIFWWGSFLLGLDEGGWLLFGITLGVFIDMAILRILVSRMYNFNTIVLIVLFVIYSIGIFGFFMGVPVFNVIAGMMAAFYIGRKMKLKGADSNIFKANLTRTNVFSTLMLIVICICSAYIALNDPYTGDNLKGMLNLNFNVTTEMIWGLIVIGGVSLVAFQYVISILIGRLAYYMPDKEISNMG